MIFRRSFDEFAKRCFHLDSQVRVGVSDVFQQGLECEQNKIRQRL